ncbi:MAG: hypothetical protein IPL90_04730 [Holophagales bacterium]|nr:hypothetical protein [Holophagales bacterium]
MRPIRLHSRLAKRSRRGFRGFPAATVAYYGPDDTKATRAVVTIVPAKDAEPVHQAVFSSDAVDVREDPFTGDKVVAFVEKHEALSVVVAQEILGCPHEEGVDFPAGGTCPSCPFWAERDRWATAKERLGTARGELLTRAIADVRAEQAREESAERGSSEENPGSGTA